RPISQTDRPRFAAGLLKPQLPDGSVGLHEESVRGAVFTSSISYVALRLLGEKPDRPELIRMRDWIHSSGTPVKGAAWGKFILSVLNLYRWEGVTPVPPELYLLPKWFPAQPINISGYVRMVYLPMAYFYGRRWQTPLDPLLRELRTELFPQGFETIDWPRHRADLAPTDHLVPESLIVRLAMPIVRVLEKWIPSSIRQKALRLAYEHICYEDEHSDFTRQAPVNACYNTLAHFVEGKTDLVDRSWRELPRYLWQFPDYTACQGFTSSKVWDTAFTLQGMNHLEPEPQRYHRLPRMGGWPFSERRNGWSIADCTAESILALVEATPFLSHPISPKIIADAVRFILSYQNRDGGWGSCDRVVGPHWIEILNASHVFADIMVDHSYAECTGSVLAALASVRRGFPDLQSAEVDRAIQQGIRYLTQTQRPDGSWEAVWGICFNYGTSFVLPGLRAVGIPANDPCISQGRKFLLEHQRADGAWGEHPDSCLARRPIPSEKGLVEPTALAVIALLATGPKEDPAVRRGLDFLLKTQQADGDFPPQPIPGLFYRTTLIRYDHYKRAFPLKVFAAFLRS
ncbi:MAG: squalene--hopene cyclase, partial [Verrucomicrobia bacterium]|nr:squalene--hopene cyclase [Verrucomicrobiota bacterium]